MLTAEQMSAIASPFSTVSDKIRALDRAGVQRAEIAHFLGKRYQHVRNVLEGDKMGRLSQALPDQGRSGEGVSDQASSFDPPPSESTKAGSVFRFMVGADGSVKLPPEVLRALGVEPLTIVPAVLENETFVFLSRLEAERRVRALVPQWRPGDTLWSDELIAERRREAASEENDD